MPDYSQVLALTKHYNRRKKSLSCSSSKSTIDGYERFNDYDSSSCDSVDKPGKISINNDVTSISYTTLYTHYRPGLFIFIYELITSKK